MRPDACRLSRDLYNLDNWYRRQLRTAGSPDGATRLFLCQKASRVPYSSNADLPDSIKGLPTEAQSVWRNVFNDRVAKGADETAARKQAWTAVKNGWTKTGDEWVRKADDADDQMFVVKADDARQMAFGWASVAVDTNGEVVTDLHKDIIDPDNLEDTVYDFVLESRTSNSEHTEKDIGQLVESMVFTDEKIAKLAEVHGEPGDPSYEEAHAALQKFLPRGWWNGYYIEDKAEYQKVADGQYAMFSIEGSGTRMDLE